ncbi:unnamed protein product [Amoebophrya sp. A120]|nr:unnamed protein product [Amoebophrya sp. A120]|eukprot:GSA120T00025742001.1
MVRFAVEGCVHGELDQIYETIQELEHQLGDKIDALLCCGDFQSVRNEDDLNNLACPPKYRQMHDFSAYWKGEKKAPLLTIFIGGNHEASNFLLDLYYGGWVAENIYYLGVAGVIDVKGVRIAGLSGIWNRHHVLMGHHERMAVDRSGKVVLDDSTMRSAYHIRTFECEKLKLLPQLPNPKRVDVFLSHDWPRDIWKSGDVHALWKRKDKTGQMRHDMTAGTFGNPLSQEVLDVVKPRFWFAAHHHVKFPALVKHDDGTCTRFLGLDKCLPGRDFLQLLEVTPEHELNAAKQAAEEDRQVVEKTQQPGAGDERDIKAAEVEDQAGPPEARGLQNENENNGGTHLHNMTDARGASLDSVALMRRKFFSSSGSTSSAVGFIGGTVGSSSSSWCAPVEQGAVLSSQEVDQRTENNDERNMKSPYLYPCYVPEWLAIQRMNIEKTDRGNHNRPVPPLTLPTAVEIETMNKRIHDACRKGDDKAMSSPRQHISTSSDRHDDDDDEDDADARRIWFDQSNVLNLDYGNLQRREISDIMNVSDIWDVLRQPRRLEDSSSANISENQNIAGLASAAAPAKAAAADLSTPGTNPVGAAGDLLPRPATGGGGGDEDIELASLDDEDDDDAGASSDAVAAAGPPAKVTRTS